MLVIANGSEMPVLDTRTATLSPVPSTRMGASPAVPVPDHTTVSVTVSVMPVDSPAGCATPAEPWSTRAVTVKLALPEA